MRQGISASCPAVGKGRIIWCFISPQSCWDLRDEGLIGIAPFLVRAPETLQWLR